MRLLRDLIRDNSTVWFYCESEDLQAAFLAQAEAEGFLTLNGHKPSELFHQYFYGINDDLTMGYLSNMIWCMTFQTGLDQHVRIDYGKYISDEEDYICHETHLKRVRFSDWNKLSYVTLDSNEFDKQCDAFIEGQTFEEYQAYIYRFLMESDWHYSPERAAKRIEDDMDYISKCYSEKVPVADCAIEVGYSCG